MAGCGEEAGSRVGWRLGTLHVVEARIGTGFDVCSSLECTEKQAPSVSYLDISPGRTGGEKKSASLPWT
jgi:hypothetical protein